MKNVIIRKACIDDIKSVKALQDEWELENITYGFVAASEEELSCKLSGEFYIAIVDEIIVGFVYGVEKINNDFNIFKHNEKYLEIEDIFVMKEYRCSEIGSKLLSKIIETSKNNNIERFSIFSSTKDINQIIKFYNRHGFKSWNIQMYM